jgi:hypothetical protein
MSHSCVYIVAGPRSCGKSTFIERCRAEKSAFLLPQGIVGLANAVGPVYLMELANRDLADEKEWLVHVDLLTPFADQTISTKNDLVSKVHSRAFEEYPGTALFRNCAQLNVITLRVPRLTTLHRYLRRTAEQGRKSVPTVVAGLYSDALGDSGYSALYHAWDQYVMSLPNAKCWDVIESSDGYSYSLMRD